MVWKWPFTANVTFINIFKDQHKHSMHDERHSCIPDDHESDDDHHPYQDELLKGHPSGLPVLMVKGSVSALSAQGLFHSLNLFPLTLSNFKDCLVPPSSESVTPG